MKIKCPKHGEQNTIINYEGEKECVKCADHYLSQLNSEEMKRIERCPKQVSKEYIKRSAKTNNLPLECTGMKTGKKCEYLIKTKNTVKCSFYNIVFSSLP